MKTNYFNQIENKFVFNFSLIFWHGLILVTLLGIIGALGALGYSLIPPSKKEVTKVSYPEKAQYPPSVKVEIGELNLESNPKSEDEPTEVPRNVLTQNELSDTEGQVEFDEALQHLKNLVPPSKYSWSGKGHWVYPYSERMWLVYHDEKYREWIEEEPGIQDKLNNSFKLLNANSYTDRRNILYSYIASITPLPEERRAAILISLLSNLQENSIKNDAFCKAISEVNKNISTDVNPGYINLLGNFARNNTKDGIPFINYVAKSINSFVSSQQILAIQKMIGAYYAHFNQNLPFLIESTDLFLTLIPQIDSDLQASALNQYYTLYIKKNASRESEISRIESEYKQAIAKIDGDYKNALAQAEMDYATKKLKKATLKVTSMASIGAGILTIVLVATILAFLSIQRSVRKIEEEFNNNKAVNS